MTRAITELHLAPRRLVGSAPLALESAVRAVTAAVMDASPADLSIGVAGVPPLLQASPGRFARCIRVQNGTQS